MKVQSLNGTWMRRIGMGEEHEQTVPYSALPVGRSVCSRFFSVNADGKRVFLRFDGITYHAWVSLNGQALGEMLPYCEYEFEITDRLTEGENHLAVELEDLNLDFGPTPGWENFGGIIRDVSLILREENYITDVFFKSRLCNEYRDAVISAEVQTDLPTDAVQEITLTDAAGQTVVSYRQAAGVTEEREVKGISLWTPETPVLYTLTVRLLEGEREIDGYTARVGFKELACSRHRFLLNGKPLFLKGVCKHEMIGESGHTVTPAQIEEDLRLIKSTGCNFVRLVHYPHAKVTLEIADRIGLMVSEEPGLWWSDTANETVASSSLEVLRRTILRDRNHVSVAFWLSFNECRFTEKFLIDSANLCRQYDPTRLVSGANCMSDEDTLLYFNKCKFDFYTMHPYAPTFDRARRSTKVLYDKPLLFTEWGGYHVFDNPASLRESLRQMEKLYQSNADTGALAGAFLWCWADVNDFNRGYPCVEGVLPEGLLTKDRQKHLCYDVFCEEIAKIDPPPSSLPYTCRLLEHYEGEPLSLVSGKGEDPEELAARIQEGEERPMPFRAAERHRQLKIPPILRREEIAGISLTPAILGNGGCFAYEGAVETDAITLIGATSFNRGYPISGALGEVAAELVVYCEDGEQRFPIRNGRELTTVFSSAGSSRIDPRADRAPRIAELSYDRNFEQYVINRLTLPLGGVKHVQRVELISADRGYQVLVYGVFADRPAH